jgi:hypothetical protein
MLCIASQIQARFDRGCEVGSLGQRMRSNGLASESWHCGGCRQSGDVTALRDHCRQSVLITVPKSQALGYPTKRRACKAPSRKERHHRTSSAGRNRLACRKRRRSTGPPLNLRLGDGGWVFARIRASEPLAFLSASFRLVADIHTVTTGANLTLCYHPCCQRT